MSKRWYLSILVLLAFFAQFAAAQTLPARFSDEEFWRLSTEFSEPDGVFRSDNLLSNETGYEFLIPDLMRTATPGRVYLGVGPEQNFNYIAALRPEVSFVIDIRRGNLDLHLMYKALFELSEDRSAFVSRLFSRKRPAGLGPKSTVQEIFSAYASIKPDEEFYSGNLKAIREHLTGKHGFALTADDISGIEYVLHAFYRFGPDLDYNSTSGGQAYLGRPATYAELMTAVDDAGQARSYLASEETFALIKNFQQRNLIIPIVGNFAGVKAIQAIGAFLKEKEAVVSEFYVSNVEQYLEAGDSWRNFCHNALTLPLDETSTFIRAVPDPAGQVGLGLVLGNMMSDLSLGTVSCR